MESMYLDDLQIHSNTEDIGFFLQTPIDGLDSPEYRTSQYDRPGEHGSFLTNQLYGSRSINLVGIIKGPNPQTFEDRRFLFSETCAINRDENGIPIPKRLTFTTLSGYTYFIDVHLAKKPVFNHNEINYSKFLLQLVAPDPLIRGETVASSGYISRPSGGGFILPVVLPIVSDAAVGGVAVMLNNGNEDAYPIITLTGPLTNPYISNSDAFGKFMQLNYTIAAGDEVVIDMAEKTITLNPDADGTGGSNILSTKTDDSEWWACVPNSNTIRLSTASSGDSGTMLVRFYPGYVGI